MEENLPLCGRCLLCHFAQHYVWSVIATIASRCFDKAALQLWTEHALQHKTIDNNRWTKAITKAPKTHWQSFFLFHIPYAQLILHTRIFPQRFFTKRLITHGHSTHHLQKCEHNTESDVSEPCPQWTNLQAKFWGSDTKCSHCSVRQQLRQEEKTLAEPQPWKKNHHHATDVTNDTECAQNNSVTAKALWGFQACWIPIKLEK